MAACAASLSEMTVCMHQSLVSGALIAQQQVNPKLDATDTQIQQQLWSTRETSTTLPQRLAPGTQCAKADVLRPHWLMTGTYS